MQVKNNKINQNKPELSDISNTSIKSKNQKNVSNNEIDLINKLIYFKKVKLLKITSKQASTLQNLTELSV